MIGRNCDARCESGTGGHEGIGWTDWRDGHDLRCQRHGAGNGARSLHQAVIARIIAAGGRAMILTIDRHCVMTVQYRGIR